MSSNVGVSRPATDRMRSPRWTPACSAGLGAWKPVTTFDVLGTPRAAKKAAKIRIARTKFAKGPASTISLLELVQLIGELRGATPAVTFDEWRLADQRYYVSDTRRFQAAAGWRASVDLHDGLERLYAWLIDNGITAPAPPAARAALAQSR